MRSLARTSEKKLRCSGQVFIISENGVHVTKISIRRKQAGDHFILSYGHLLKVTSSFLWVAVWRRIQENEYFIKNQFGLVQLFP